MWREVHLVLLSYECMNEMHFDIKELRDFEASIPKWALMQQKIKSLWILKVASWPNLLLGVYVYYYIIVCIYRIGR